MARLIKVNASNRKDILKGDSLYYRTEQNNFFCDVPVTVTHVLETGLLATVGQVDPKETNLEEGNEIIVNWDDLWIKVS